MTFACVGQGECLPHLIISVGAVRAIGASRNAGASAPCATLFCAYRGQGARLLSRVLALLVLVVALAATAPSAAQPSEPPSGLWQPPPSAGVEDPTFLYLESEPGEWYADGATVRYAWNEARFVVVDEGRQLRLVAEGDEGWVGVLHLPAGQRRFREGYYGDLRYRDDGTGWVYWQSGSVGCDSTYGWLMVDEIAYDGDRIERLRVRFEQRCHAADAPPLRGAYAYDEDRRGRAYNPRVAPDGAWQPADAPAAGPYLVTEGGNYVGPSDARFTDDNANFVVDALRERVEVRVGSGDTGWAGTFAPPNGYGRLRRGYYAKLQRWPFDNPAEGGLDWTGDGRACNRVFGWFMVDDITYDELDITSLTLRFEHRCEVPDGDPMYGKVRWSGAPPQRAQVRYRDTDGSAHRDAIHALTRARILGGYNDDTFRPQRRVSRGQMAAFLTRALDLRRTGYGIRPSDIEGHAHEEAIQILVDHHIAGGYPDGTFRPNAAVRRDEMATVLARAFRYWERDGDARFPDIDGNTHKDNILLVAEARTAGGYPDGTFRPQRPVTRGQLATFLYRAMTRTPDLADAGAG